MKINSMEKLLLAVTNESHFIIDTDEGHIDMNTKEVLETPFGTIILWVVG
jgi:hypothetical protein